MCCITVSLLGQTGVLAGLSARATGAESVSSGTLTLTRSADVGAGFSSFTGKLAPGDTDNVFITLTNTGTLASAAGMTLTVSGAPANALTDGTVAGEGLTVTLTQCSRAWTLATGVCAGTTTSILATTPVHTLATATALSNVPALAAATGKVAHLRVSLGLTATERSTNGVAPASTVQGLSTTLTYTFTEQQRAGVATGK